VYQFVIWLGSVFIRFIPLCHVTATPSESIRPETGDEELRNLGNGAGDADRSPSPSLALTDGDYGRDPDTSVDTQRSTLLR